jgi:hypothetical protein
MTKFIYLNFRKIQVQTRQYNLFLFYFIFGNFNIQTYYMFSGHFDSRVFVDWLKNTRCYKTFNAETLII